MFVAAIVFGFGVAYFWPTMLGFVSENIPKSGALGINLLGGAGMFAVSIYMFFMGGYYDSLVRLYCPQVPAWIRYCFAAAGTPEAAAYAHAQLVAGPQVIQATNIIPLVLTFAFLGLYIYQRSRKKKLADESLQEVSVTV